MHGITKIEKKTITRHTHECVLLLYVYKMRWWRAPKLNENQTNN